MKPNPPRTFKPNSQSSVNSNSTNKPTTGDENANTDNVVLESEEEPNLALPKHSPIKTRVSPLPTSSSTTPQCSPVKQESPKCENCFTAKGNPSSINIRVGGKIITCKDFLGEKGCKFSGCLRCVKVIFEKEKAICPACETIWENKEVLGKRYITENKKKNNINQTLNPFQEIIRVIRIQFLSLSKEYGTLRLKLAKSDCLFFSGDCVIDEFMYNERELCYKAIEEFENSRIKKHISILKETHGINLSCFVCHGPIHKKEGTTIYACSLCKETCCNNCHRPSHDGQCSGTSRIIECKCHFFTEIGDNGCTFCISCRTFINRESVPPYLNFFDEKMIKDQEPSVDEDVEIPQGFVDNFNDNKKIVLHEVGLYNNLLRTGYDEFIQGYIVSILFKKDKNNSYSEKLIKPPLQTSFSQRNSLYMFLFDKYVSMDQFYDNKKKTNSEYNTSKGKEKSVVRDDFSIVMKQSVAK